MTQHAFRFKDSSNSEFKSYEDWLISQVADLQTEVEILSALIDGVIAHVFEANLEENTDEN